MKTLIRSLSIICLLGGILTGNAMADRNHVTVYNSDLGLVKQVRTLTIDENSPTLRFTDVAGHLIPASVHLKNRSGRRFRILEQNFEFDLVSSDKILEKYIDHPITIITEAGELIEGVLLSSRNRSLVLKRTDGIRLLTLNDRMSVSVKDLPAGLITRPTLVWELADVKAGSYPLEVSYLTSGMNWQAEYVGVLDQDETRLELDSWVSVDNRCGMTFKEARLKLVAGEVHRAPAPAPSPRPTLKREMLAAVADGGFEERAFLEYHIYELDRATTLKDNQTKQISLYPQAQASCQKRFEFEPARAAEKIAVKFLLNNTKASGLGKPLPAGVVRIYKRDGDSLEFAGEDRIEHVARNGEIELTLGNAFDLGGKKTVVERKKVSNRSQRQAVEIVLSNGKTHDDVEICVRERMPWPSWKIEKSSVDYEKIDAGQVLFKVRVPADGRVTLTYTVLSSW